MSAVLLPAEGLAHCCPNSLFLQLNVLVKGLHYFGLLLAVGIIDSLDHVALSVCVSVHATKLVCNTGRKEGTLIKTKK